MQNSSFKNVAIIAAVTATLFTTQSARAVNVYWDTNGATAGASAGTTANGTWDAASTGNWTTDSTGLSATGSYATANGSSPSTADVFFSAGSNATGVTSITLSGAVVANSITIEDGAMSITSATTTPSLTLGAGGLTIANTAAGASTWISTLPVILSTTQTWTNNLATGATNLFTVNGTITGAASTAVTLNVAGTGDMTFAGAIANGTSGTVAINKTGAGVLTLSSTTSSYTGGVTIAGGVVSTANNLNLGATGNAVSLNGGTLRVTAGYTDTHVITVGASGGTINVNAGTGQLYLHTANTLLGSGTLTLTGSGTLTANSGNLRVDVANSYSGNMIVQNGGIFEYGTAGAVGSTATFNVNSNGELAVQGSAAVALPNTITVNGGVLSFENGTAGSFSGTTITLNGTGTTIGLRDWYNNATVRSGTISGLLTGTGGVTVNSGTGSGGVLTLSNTANDYAGATVINSSIVNFAALGNVNTASSIGKGSAGGSAADIILSGGTLRYTGATAQSTDRLFSVGTSGGTLDASGTNNANALTFVGTGAMGFNSQTGARTLTLTGSNTGANLLGLAIGDNSGATSLTKTGAGTWALSGTNNYSGATTVSVGTLDFLNTGAKSSSSTITVAAAAGLGLGVGGSGFFSSTDVDAMFANTLTGVTMNATSLGGIDTTAGNFTYATNLTSVLGGLVKLGSNTLTLSGNESYTGTTSVLNGVLALSGSNTNTGATSVASTGTLRLIGNGTVGGTNTSISASSALTLNNGSTLQLRGDVNNTFAPSSTTIVAGSTVNFDVANATSGSGNKLSLGNTITQGGAATFNVSGSNSYILGLGAVVGNGSTTFTPGSGANLTVTSWTGVSTTQDNITFSGAGNTTLGVITAGGTSGTSGRFVTLTMNQTGTVTLTGSNNIDNKSNSGGSTVVNLNSGTTVLDNTGAFNSAQNFFQSFTIGGITNVAANSTNVSLLLGDTNFATGGISQNRSFVVEDGGASFANTGTFTIGGQNTSGINTFSGNFTLGATTNTGKGVTLIAATGGEVDFTGQFLVNGTDTTAGVTVGDASHTGIVKFNNGTGSTYAGTTTVLGGTLLYGANNQIATGAVTVNGSTAKLDLGASHTDTVGTVTVDGGGSITGTGTSALTSTGTFEMKSGSASAILAGSGIALNKTTSGTATLSGVNTYTGATTVTTGTLIVSSTGSINSSSAITVGIAGTFQYDSATTAGNVSVDGILKGTGKLGDVTVSSTGSVRPGDSPGNLTVANFTLASGTLAEEITGAGGSGNAGSTYDLLTAGGSVDLGTGTLAADGTITATVNALYFIINKTSAGAVTGLLNGVAQGGVVTLGSQQFNISYTGDFATDTFAGAGNDVVLQAIPEPSTWGMMAASLGLFFVVNRGRRSKL